MLFANIIFVSIIFCAFPRSICTENIADELKTQFYDNSTQCIGANNETHPAYECSGIIIRSVRNVHTDLKFAWSLKPRDKEKFSLAYGFLRYDTPFSTFPRGLSIYFSQIFYRFASFILKLYFRL